MAKVISAVSCPVIKTSSTRGPYSYLLTYDYSPQVDKAKFLYTGSNREPWSLLQMNSYTELWMLTAIFQLFTVVLNTDLIMRIF